MKIYFYETLVNNLPLSVLAIRLKNTRRSFDECYKFIGMNCCLTWATDGTFINVKTQGGECHQLRIGNWIVQHLWNTAEYDIYSNKEFKKEFKRTNRYIGDKK